MDREIPREEKAGSLLHRAVTMLHPEEGGQQQSGLAVSLLVCLFQKEGESPEPFTPAGLQ